jgi:hypothetical protein
VQGEQGVLLASKMVSKGLIQFLAQLHLLAVVMAMDMLLLFPVEMVVLVEGDHKILLQGVLEVLEILLL